MFLCQAIKICFIYYDWMTDRWRPTSIDAAGGDGSTNLSGQEREDQDRLNRGIETLLTELIRHHLSAPDRETFDAGKPLEAQTGQPELPRSDRDVRTTQSTSIRQESYASPTQTGKFVPIRLSFSFRSADFSVNGLADYGDDADQPPDSLTRTGLSITGLSVHTQQHLEEARTRLTNCGFLPPEPQAPGEPLAPRPSGVVFKPGMPEPV